MSNIYKNTIQIKIKQQQQQQQKQQQQIFFLFIRDDEGRRTNE